MRKTQQIKPRPVYAAIVDGECESWYIHMLKRNEPALRVDLKPSIPKKKKLKEQYDEVVRLANDYDHVFWIIDLDVAIKQTREARKGSKTAMQEFKEYYKKFQKKKNVTVIINNPCLEYWILLHYHPAAGQRYDNCDSVKNHLHKHCESYEKTEKYYTRQNNDIYRLHKPKLQDAIRNAKVPLPFDIDTFDANIAFSQMHLLFEADGIREIILAE